MVEFDCYHRLCLCLHLDVVSEVKINDLPVEKLCGKYTGRVIYVILQVMIFQ